MKDLFRSRKQYDLEDENLLQWQNELTRKNEELQNENEELLFMVIFFSFHSRGGKETYRLRSVLIKFILQADIFSY